MPPSLPWLFLPQKHTAANLQFYSLSEHRIYKLAFPEVEGARKITGSASGFLLVVSEDEVLIINPFTKERVHLPNNFPLQHNLDITTWDYSGSIVVAYFGCLGGVRYCRPGDHRWSTINDVPSREIGSIHKIIYKSGSFYLHNYCVPSVFYVWDAEMLNLTRIIDCPGLHYMSSRFILTSDDTLLYSSYYIVDEINRRYRPVLFNLNRQNSIWSEITDLGDYAMLEDGRFAFIFEASRHVELWKTTRFHALIGTKYAKIGTYNISTSNFGNLLSEQILDPDSYSSHEFLILPSFGTT